MSREENNCKQQLQHQQQQQQQQQQKVDQKSKKVPLSFSYWWSPSFTCKIDPATKNLLMAVFSLETHNPPSKSHPENRQSCRENRWIKSC